MGTTSLAAEGFTSIGAGGGVPTIDTTTVRSGACALKVVLSSNSYWLNYAFTATLTRRYSARVALNMTTLPGVNQSIMTLTGSGDGRGAMVMISAAGVITLENWSTDVTVLTGPTLVTGQYYVIELGYVGSTGVMELRIDGMVYTTTGETTASTAYTLQIGPQLTDSLTWYIDDVAFNDDQTGAGQTSWPGMGKIVMLRPTSDSSRTGYTTGAAGTTALWDCVNNFPPVGVVQTSSTSTSQIKDATSNTTDNYVASLPAYTTAVASSGGGMATIDKVALVQGVAVQGYNTTTSQSAGIKVTTNPAVAEVTGSSGTTLASTYPTGWTTLRTAYSYQPVVTLGTAVTMTFRKNTATSNSSMCCFIALQVEYTLFVPPRLALLGVG